MTFSFSRAFYFAVRRALTWGLAGGVIAAVAIGISGGEARSIGSAVVAVPYLVFWVRLIWEVFMTDPPNA